MVVNGNGSGSWLRDNAGMLLSTLIVVAGIFIAWGRTSAQVVQLQADQIKLEERIKSLESQVRSHHEDTERHVDSNFKQEVRDRFTAVEQLLHQHVLQTAQFARGK